MSEWINTNDITPSEHEYVLTFDGETIRIASYWIGCEEEKLWNSNEWPIEPTHWMPLPKPPESI